MPLCTIHLLALDPAIPLPAAISILSALQPSPLVLARVVRWIIKPQHTTASVLLDTRWDFLLILPPSGAPVPSLALPSNLTPMLAHSYSFPTGIPSRQTSSFATLNPTLLRPDAPAPPLTGSLMHPVPAQGDANQHLEWTPALAEWAAGWDKSAGPGGAGAVSMLNLLRFKPGLLASYQEYGRKFGEGIGSKRGGVVKLVGKIVEAPNSAPAQGQSELKTKGDAGEWEEFALAHYPSIHHFLDMAASEDYQAVNRAKRLPALEDTCILMTSEVVFADSRGARL